MIAGFFDLNCLSKYSGFLLFLNVSSSESFAAITREECFPYWSASDCYSDSDSLHSTRISKFPVVTGSSSSLPSVVVNSRYRLFLTTTRLFCSELRRLESLSDTVVVPQSVDIIELVGVVIGATDFRLYRTGCSVKLVSSESDENIMEAPLSLR